MLKQYFSRLLNHAYGFMRTCFGSSAAVPVAMLNLADLTLHTCLKNVENAIWGLFTRAGLNPDARECNLPGCWILPMGRTHSIRGKVPQIIAFVLFRADEYRQMAKAECDGLMARIDASHSNRLSVRPCVAASKDHFPYSEPSLAAQAANDCPLTTATAGMRQMDDPEKRWNFHTFATFRLFLAWGYMANDLASEFRSRAA